MASQEKSDKELFFEPASTEEELDKKAQNVFQPNLNFDALCKKYDEWANSYDQDMRNHSALANRTALGLQNLDVPKDAKILDCCAGTGLVGAELAKLGYKNIDAIDGCANMLERARKKEIYQNFFIAEFGKGKIQAISDDHYDAITCGASMYTNHLDESWLQEFIRLVRPGGVIVIQSTYEPGEETYRDKMEAVMKRYHDNKSLEWLSKEEFDNEYVIVVHSFKVP